MQLNNQVKKKYIDIVLTYVLFYIYKGKKSYLGSGIGMNTFNELHFLKNSDMWI